MERPNVGLPDGLHGDDEPRPPEFRGNHLRPDEPRARPRPSHALPARDGPTGTRPTPAAGGTATETEACQDGPVTARRLTKELLALGSEVAAAPTRRAAEESACEGLVAADRYRSAWIGVRAPVAADLVVRTGEVVGEEQAGVAPVAEPRLSLEPDGYCERAVESGSVQSCRAAELGEDAWPVHDSQLEAGVVAFVPLAGSDEVDALLAVHTVRSNGLGELESAALDTLGTTLGMSMDVCRTRDLLFGERAVRVEVRVADDDSLFVRLAEAQDCRVSLDGYTIGKGRWKLTCDVVGAGADSFVAAADADPVVVDTTTVVDRTDGCRVELVVDDLHLLDRAKAAGATVSNAVADGGACEAHLDLPPSGNVCETLGQLRVAFPDLDFLSRCGVDDGPFVPKQSAGLLDDLTERQHEALAVAHRSGYFDWPRQHTAEEIAAELGITSPTFHWHLRHAESELVDAIIE